MTESNIFNQLGRTAPLRYLPGSAKEEKENKYLKKKKYTWHLTPDTWIVTRDMWHMVGGDHSLKISAPQLLQFGFDSVLNILKKGWPN